MGRRSRRGFVGMLLGFFVGPSRSLPQDGGERTKVRQYRADAVILLLGIPLYRRAGVGGGQASVTESGEGASLRRTLFFAGGSDPKRAHGLNRLGWIREIVTGPRSAPTQSDYFGVLTSSPEESLEHARKSIAGPQSGRSIYSAVNGHNTGGHSRSAVTHFDFASDGNWSNAGLIAEAQATFRGQPAWRDTAWPNLANQAPSTCLLQLATLLEQRAKHAAGRYVYNEEEFLMELDASPQGGGGAPLLVVRGKIRNLRTGYQATFRLWIDEASDSIVPVRIEFQPRSFLRLTFEAVPA